jgi:hypothetical protein
MLQPFDREALRAEFVAAKPYPHVKSQTSDSCHLSSFATS